MGPYIGTVTKLAVIHVGRAQKYEIRNLLIKTFHLIYYMTLPHPLERAPKYEIHYPASLVL